MTYISSERADIVEALYLGIPGLQVFLGNFLFGYLCNTMVCFIHLHLHTISSFALTMKYWICMTISFSYKILDEHFPAICTCYDTLYMTDNLHTYQFIIIIVFTSVFRVLSALNCFIYTFTLNL
jgi:hypothetical protein